MFHAIELEYRRNGEGQRKSNEKACRILHKHSIYNEKKLCSFFFSFFE